MSQHLAAAGARCWVDAVVVMWADMTSAHVHTNNVDWVAGKQSPNGCSLSPRPPSRTSSRRRQTSFGPHTPGLS